MLIIDMDMPKSCEKCEFFDDEDTCYIDGTYALNPNRIRYRPSWCPIKCDIEDIKQEIKWLIGLSGGDDAGMLNEGLYKTLDIIDKHTK